MTSVNNTEKKADPGEQQIRDAMARLQNRLAGAGLTSTPISLSPTNMIDIRIVVNTLTKVRTELFQIDQVLARRSALDDYPTRVEKIQRAITVAGESDSMRVIIRNLQDMIRNVKRVVDQFREAAPGT